MKTKLILISASVMAIGLLYWLASYGYVEISMIETGSSTAEVVLSDHNRRKEKTFTGVFPSVKKLVRKSAYDVSVRQDESSYFTTTQTSGFLKTTKIEVKLSPERRRIFMGNNPAGCMSHHNGTVLSWDCLGPLGNGAIHTQATLSSPSVTRSLHGRGDATIEAVLSSSNGQWALAQFPAEAESGGAVHGFYPISNSGQMEISRGRILPDLSSSRTYGVRPYKAGFLVFSLDGLDLLYYKSLAAKPRRLQVSRPEEANLPLYSLSVYQDSILLIYGDGVAPELNGSSLYSSSPEDSDSETNDNATGLDSGRATLLRGNVEQSFSLDFGVTQARLCGEALLCVLHNSKLDIYDIRQGDLKRLHSISRVVQIENNGRYLLVVRDYGVLALNPDDNTGYYDYRFADYTYCGLRVLGDNYLLCIDDNSAKPRARSILYVNRSQRIVDDIDKKVYRLSHLPEVAAVSTYRNFIHLSPSVEGVPLVTSSHGGLVPSPDELGRINKVIADYIAELRIDRKKYFIINALE